MIAASPLPTLRGVTDEAPPEAELRVAIVAPNPTTRAGLAALLAATPGLDVVASAPGLSRWVDDEAPEGIDAAVVEAPELDLAGFETPVVILGESPAWDPAAPAVAGRAFLGRDASVSQVAAALHAVVLGLAVVDPSLTPAAPRPASGETETLTAREMDVLRLLAGGLTNKAIAYNLGISDHTAKFHVGAILSKLGAESRTEAVTIAHRRGLLPL